MNGKQILERVKEYNERLDQANVPSITSLSWNESAFQLDHVRSTLGAIPSLVQEGRLSVAFRELGFAQGILYTLGYYTRKEIKQHND